jgi:hypothetical protein
MPPVAGGSGWPTLDPPTTDVSGATPHQPISARTPSATASAACSIDESSRQRRRAAAVRAVRAGISVPSIERLFGWRAGSAMLQTYVAAHADSIAHEEFARLRR